MTANAIPPLLPDAILASGTDVIRREAQGLEALAAALDARFVEAASQLVSTNGRVLVSGMGKSGLICRKIAATFSATGTAAFFLHPAEAGHGDLGSLKAGDTLLVLSNSGATRELRPLIGYAREIGVPIIAIASVADSDLIRQAAIGLILPSVPEACPERIAPTTSTTMMLALGDALALAAMQMRGITREDLVRWHPGGQIGWDATQLAMFVDPGLCLPLVRADADMRLVLDEITRCGKGIAGVIDPAGELIGVITDGDLRRSFDLLPVARAHEVMCATPKTLEQSASIGDARRIMEDARILALFITPSAQSRQPIGLVHLHDLARPQ